MLAIVIGAALLAVAIPCSRGLQSVWTHWFERRGGVVSQSPVVGAFSRFLRYKVLTDEGQLESQSPVVGAFSRLELQGCRTDGVSPLSQSPVVGAFSRLKRLVRRPWH